MILILTVKTNTKEHYHRKKPHIIFIDYTEIQNIYKESSKPESAMQTTWEFPPKHKIQPGTISVSAALQLLQADLYQKALSQKYNFCYAGEESHISLKHNIHTTLTFADIFLTVLFCLSQVLACFKV